MDRTSKTLQTPAQNICQHACEISLFFSRIDQIVSDLDHHVRYRILRAVSFEHMGNTIAL